VNLLFGGLCSPARSYGIGLLLFLNLQTFWYSVLDFRWSVKGVDLDCTAVHGYPREFLLFSNATILAYNFSRV
jgi:hypothetical protein